MEEKSFGNILIIRLHIKLSGIKSLRKIFRKYDRTKDLASFTSDEKYNKIFDRMSKSNILDFYFIKNMKIRINSDDDLPLEKTLNIHNVLILIRALLNKDYNHIII